MEVLLHAVNQGEHNVSALEDGAMVCVHGKLQTFPSLDDCSLLQVFLPPVQVGIHSLFVLLLPWSTGLLDLVQELVSAQEAEQKLQQLRSRFSLLAPRLSPYSGQM